MKRVSEREREKLKSKKQPKQQPKRKKKERNVIFDESVFLLINTAAEGVNFSRHRNTTQELHHQISYINNVCGWD